MGGGRGGLGGGLGGGNLGGGLGGATQQGATFQTRLTLRIKPQMRRSSTVVQTKVERLVNRSRRIKRVAGEEIKVTVDGRTATVSGTVETEFDRDRAVGVVKLEPGITQIVDELVVANPETETER